MTYLKKLTFTPIFLIFFALFCYQISFVLNNSLELIFSLSLTTLFQLLGFTLLLCFSSIFFAVFITFSQDLKIDLPVILIASFLPILFLPNLTGQVLTAGFLISFLAIYFVLKNSLKKYLNFSPSKVLGSHVKSLTLLLILTLSFGYFFSIRTEILKNGFQIPDSLIETALKFSMPQDPNVQVQGTKYLAQGIALTEEQKELLRQNPALLEQYGVTPEMIDATPTAPTRPRQVSPQTNLTTPSDDSFDLASTELARGLIKDQLNKILEPYIDYMPFILAILFFLSLVSLTSLIFIVLPIILWFIFMILEELKFAHFEKEMREVKKLVV